MNATTSTTLRRAALAGLLLLALVVSVAPANALPPISVPNPVNGIWPSVPLPPHKVLPDFVSCVPAPQLDVCVYCSDTDTGVRVGLERTQGGYMLWVPTFVAGSYGEGWC